MNEHEYEGDYAAKEGTDTGACACGRCARRAGEQREREDAARDEALEQAREEARQMSESNERLWAVVRQLRERAEKAEDRANEYEALVSGLEKRLKRVAADDPAERVARAEAVVERLRGDVRQLWATALGLADANVRLYAQLEDAEEENAPEPPEPIPGLLKAETEAEGALERFVRGIRDEFMAGFRESLEKARR